MPTSSDPRHVVFVCGGAVAGSEAASVFAARGILTVVVDQNTRPYGKIEDGLPRWHEKLRRKEYGLIDERLTADNVLFVPKLCVGKDVSFEEVLGQWKPSALVLATGAWRDRPLSVPGVDAFVGRGLLYQNPFVYWFNHYPEPSYAWDAIDVQDGAVVVGGGLASIDVVKIINLELYGKALRARGIETTTVELEHAGIAATLAKHDLTPEELGVEGCRLYYRRRKCDMPLADLPDDPTPADVEKAERVRAKIMDNVIRKYLVRLEELHLPVATIVEGERLVGLRFRRTEMAGGKLREVEGTDYDVRAPLVVGSIGSIPEPLAGVPQQGELYAWADWDNGELAGLPGVYGLGNVLTGKGNIKESRDSARRVSERVADAVLAMDPLPADHVQSIVKRIESCWIERGYRGYPAWIEGSPPLDRLSS